MKWHEAQLSQRDIAIRLSMSARECTSLPIVLLSRRAHLISLMGATVNYVHCVNSSAKCDWPIAVQQRSALHSS